MGKELRQHAFTFGVLALLLLGGLALIGNHPDVEVATGGGFSEVHLLHQMLVPLACLVLGQVLIAAEFRQKTQLFLEGLPLPRWRMLAIKFGLGLAMMVGAIGAALAVAWWRARHSEAMTPRFATLLSLKSLGWVWFLYTLCFAHAFLGRYRAVFGLALLFGWLYLQTAGLEPSTFGPFALMDDRFAHERFVVPAKALAVTAALGLGLAALGFALGLIRDASVAALLAEKMSAREKVFMTLFVFVGISVAGYVVEHRQKGVEVQMPGAVEAQHGVVRVLASAAVDAPSTEEMAALDATARRAADELGALAAYLGCPTFPPVLIVHRRDLPGGDLIAGDVEKRRAVLVRANLTDERYDESALHAWLVRETLLAHSSGLAGRERNAWVLDGLTWWWPHSERARDGRLAPAARDAARGVMPADFAAEHLRAWLSLRRRIGDEAARRLAGSGLAVLAQHHGAESVRRFLSAMLATPRASDVRGWWRDVLDPASARLRTATGLDEAAFVAEWRAALSPAP